MATVVTGATGLVGRALVAALREHGDEVRVLSRSAERARARLGSDVTCFGWNPISEDAPPAAFEGAEAVVHLAGESVVGRWTAAKRRAIVDSRVIGTRRLVAGIREAADPSIALISASAIGYYGDCGDEDVTEERPPADDFLGRCSVAWEREALAAAEGGHRVVTPRLGIVLSRQGGALASMLPAFRWGFGGSLGSGRQWWSWIHIADLVSLLLAAKQDDWSGAYNATSPTPMRQADFARALAATLTRPAFLPAPAWVLRLILGGFAVELLGSKRVIPRRTAEAGFRYVHPTLRDALGSLLAD